jgi:hypothetical protein
LQIVGAIAFAAIVAVIATLNPQKASAERVCRLECLGPVCQDKCIETDGRGDRRERFEMRREGQSRDGRAYRQERDVRGPGFGLLLPGVEIEIAR